MRFPRFFSSGFITAIVVVNPPERKLAKRTYVQWYEYWGQSVYEVAFKLYYTTVTVSYLSRSFDAQS